MAQLLPFASPFGLGTLRARWTSRSKRVPTVLAPALPALVLLAVTTAGMVDPPPAGLATQLHVSSVATIHTGPTSSPSTESYPVTAR
jgi:hypothetical protein